MLLSCCIDGAEIRPLPPAQECGAVLLDKSGELSFGAAAPLLVTSLAEVESIGLAVITDEALSFMAHPQCRAASVVTSEQHDRAPDHGNTVFQVPESTSRKPFGHRLMERVETASMVCLTASLAHAGNRRYFLQQGQGQGAGVPTTQE